MAERAYICTGSFSFALISASNFVRYGPSMDEISVGLKQRRISSGKYSSLSTLSVILPSQRYFCAFRLFYAGASGPVLISFITSRSSLGYMIQTICINFSSPASPGKYYFTGKSQHGVRLANDSTWEHDSSFPGIKILVDLKNHYGIRISGEGLPWTEHAHSTCDAGCLELVHFLRGESYAVWSMTLAESESLLSCCEPWRAA